MADEFPIILIVGLVGIGGMVAFPIYMIHLFKQKEYRKGLMHGIVPAVVCFALALSWLMSGATPT